MPIDVLRVDHTGITVSNLDRSVTLWRDVLGFEVTRGFELTGDFASGLELIQPTAPAPGGRKDRA
jgi:catechol 2,3-dioxygenase-like lactoylglutathione lyase family enzyme